MYDIEFTSTLAPSYRGELERLLFFNLNQERVRSSILLLIERYGVPRVQEEGNRLRVTVESPVEPQTLYVLDRSGRNHELVGVLVYTREDGTLSVLHLAVREDRSHQTRKDAEVLVVRMIDKLRSVARRIKGVSSITLFPGTPKAKQLRVFRKHTYGDANGLGKC